MKLGIFGTGHVGLVTSVCFAELGHSVVAVEKNPEVVAKLRAIMDKQHVKSDLFPLRALDEGKDGPEKQEK